MAANRHRSTIRSIIYMLAFFFAVATLTTIAAGVDLKIAVLWNVLSALNVDLPIIPYNAMAQSDAILFANTIDTFIFAMLTVILASWFFNFIRTFSLRRGIIISKVKKLREHVILVPYNSFSVAMSRQIAAAGMKRVTIVENEREADQLYAQNELSVIGDRRTVEAYQAAQIDKASYLMICGEDDVENALVAVTAKSTNPRIRIIARVKTEEDIPKVGRAGVYRMILPEVTAGNRIGEELVKRFSAQEQSG